LVVATLPVMIVAALCIWITAGAPVFYMSTRYIGVTRSIRVMKFRTMVRDATAPKYNLAQRFMRDGYLDIPLTCEVYTPVGRVLERLQIVELPQLIHVLFHGMSLVGNRPLPKQNVELLSQFSGWSTRFDSPAGITGVAQIVGKLNLLPVQRLRLESLYSKVHQEGDILRCDLFIIWHTLGSVLLRNKGVPYARAEAFLLRCLPPSYEHDG